MDLPKPEFSKILASFSFGYAIYGNILDFHMRIWPFNEISALSFFTKERKSEICLDLEFFAWV